MRTWRDCDERERKAAVVDRADKLRIVLVGMEPNVEVSDLCRHEGLNPVQFCAWKKQLRGAAERVFEDRRGRPDAREQRREAEVQWLKNVIAEITAENLDQNRGVQARGSRQAPARASKTCS